MKKRKAEKTLQTGQRKSGLVSSCISEKAKSEKLKSSPDYIPVKNSAHYLICLSLITAIGVYFRWDQFGSQLVGDDEWHAVRIATRHTYSYILTHFQTADNCVPLTFLYKVFLDTIGLNELTLRILQGSLGTAMIVLFPLFVRRMVGNASSLIFALLIAVSPILIYYSRFARPYIIVAFLSVLAVLSFYYWLEQRRKIFLSVYLLFGVLSIYFSPVSAPIVYSPVAVAFVLTVLQKKGWIRTGEEIKIGFSESVAILSFLTAGILLWLVPAIGSIEKISGKAGEGHYVLKTFTDSMNMFSGYENLSISLLFIPLLAAGVFHLYKNRRFLCLYLAAVMFLQILSVTVTAPYNIHLPHVFARYNIAALPIFLLFVSMGIYGVLKYIPEKRMGMHNGDVTITSIALLIVLFLSYRFGPLPFIYKGINNFMNHDNYQYGYTSSMYGNDLNSSELNEFYRNLKEDETVGSIIEYPYLIWWSGNFYHIYQKYHQKRVKIGYMEPYVLLLVVKETENMHFQNFVNIGSPERLSASGCSYVVIHKDMERELAKAVDLYEKETLLRGYSGKKDGIKEYAYFHARKSAEKAISVCQQHLGPPVYEDPWISVFHIETKKDIR